MIQKPIIFVLICQVLCHYDMYANRNSGHGGSDLFATILLPRSQFTSSKLRIIILKIYPIFIVQILRSTIETKK